MLLKTVYGIDEGSRRFSFQWDATTGKLYHFRCKIAASSCVNISFVSVASAHFGIQSFQNEHGGWIDNDLHMRIILFFITGLVAIVLQGFAEETPIHREDTEWVEISVPGINKTTPARVLLIGDSITSSYYWAVGEKLKDQVTVSKLATSKSIGDPALLKEVAYVLDHCNFDVVHFNNGMHGRDYTEQDYAKSFPDLIATIRKHAPKAKLIWASTTPTREGEGFIKVEVFTERVKERNRLAAEAVSSEGIKINDLFAVVAAHPEFYADGVHFNPKGIEAQATAVAGHIRTALDAK